jgi:hypothetical protein
MRFFIPAVANLGPNFETVYADLAKVHRAIYGSSVPCSGAWPANLLNHLGARRNHLEHVGWPDDDRLTDKEAA